MLDLAFVGGLLVLFAAFYGFAQVCDRL